MASKAAGFMGRQWRPNHQVDTWLRLPNATMDDMVNRALLVMDVQNGIVERFPEQAASLLAGAAGPRPPPTGPGRS